MRWISSVAPPNPNRSFGLIVLGTGLLKPNVSTLVGSLYAPDDRRREAGFSLPLIGTSASPPRESACCSG